MVYGCESCQTIYHDNDEPVQDVEVVCVSSTVLSCPYCEGKTTKQLVLEIRDLLKRETNDR